MAFPAVAVAGDTHTEGPVQYRFDGAEWFRGRGRAHEAPKVIGGVTYAEGPDVPNYLTTAQYEKDELVWHDGQLFRALQQITSEAFNIRHWENTLPSLQEQDPAKAYTQDTLVKHDGRLLRAKAPVSIEAFNETHWDVIPKPGFDAWKVVTIPAGGTAAAPVQYDLLIVEMGAAEWDSHHEVVISSREGNYLVHAMITVSHDRYRCLIEINASDDDAASGANILRELGAMSHGNALYVVAGFAAPAGQIVRVGVNSYMFSNTVFPKFTIAPTVRGTRLTHIVNMDDLSFAHYDSYTGVLKIMPRSQKGEFLPTAYQLPTDKIIRVDKPWNTAWGHVADSLDTSWSSSGITHTNEVPVTVQMRRGRKYKITASTSIYTYAAATEYVYMKLLEAATIHATFNTYKKLDTDSTSIFGIYYHSPTADSNNSWSLTTSSVSNHEMGNTMISVEDVGPA